MSKSNEKSVWKSGSLISGIVWFLSYIGARAAAESADSFSRAGLIAVVLIPVVPAALFLYFFITELRDVDELQRRIQLEALAFAYPLTLLLLMSLGLLQLVMDLDPDNWSFRHVWQFVFMFYLLGIGVSVRRYQ